MGCNFPPQEKQSLAGTVAQCHSALAQLLSKCSPGERDSLHFSSECYLPQITNPTMAIRSLFGFHAMAYGIQPTPFQV